MQIKHAYFSNPFDSDGFGKHKVSLLEDGQELYYVYIAEPAGTIESWRARIVLNEAYQSKLPYGEITL